MAKVNWFVWRRRIMLGVAAAVCSFIVSLILPWNRLDYQAISYPATQQVQTQKQGEDVASVASCIGSNSADAQTHCNNLNAKPNDAFRKLIQRLEQQAKEARLTFGVPKQFQGKTLEAVKLTSQEKVIALTFDDGPYPEYTPPILDILKKNNIKGTFFWIGQNLKAFPELGKQVVAEGHAIGNHTWHHWYKNMSAAVAAREIEDTTELIYKTTGVRTSLFRPPGGYLYNGVADYAKKKNYLVAMWSADSSDYSRPGVDKLVNNVMRNAKPGGMVLMHDGGGNRVNTVKALPIIINKLRQQGYKFVTVSELFELQEKEQLAATEAKKAASATGAIEKPLSDRPDASSVQ